MTASTLKQGSLVTPKTAIAMDRTKAHPGQTFWVTDSVIARAEWGTIQIAESGKNSGYAIAISLADFEANFDAVSTF